jgi:hypothetical protein
MEALKLWTPLCEMLESETVQDREMACWCLGTAVQNNIKCQERVSFDFFPLVLGRQQLLTLRCIRHWL